MDVEKALVDYIVHADLEGIPEGPQDTIRNMVLTVLGTIVAGSRAEGCESLVRFYREVGGSQEATIFIHGGRIPAQNAVLVNSVMARALDFDDAMAPGIHIGASAVPTALAAAELAGGCSGKDFLTALVLGVETAARLNLTESTYDGFDPTGVCTVFASTVVASRILGLSESETWNALALAFNRSGGSFQSNIDGSLAVRVIQGTGTFICMEKTRLILRRSSKDWEGVSSWRKSCSKNTPVADSPWEARRSFWVSWKNSTSGQEILTGWRLQYPRMHTNLWGIPSK
jgi:hypothetical protein